MQRISMQDRNKPLPEPPSPRSLWRSIHTLLIGIDEYRNMKNRSLNGAVNDLKSMTEFLTSVLEDLDNIITLTNEKATRDNIVASFGRLKTDPSIYKVDPILVFYAGHGGTIRKPQNWDAPGSEIQCLVVYDADCEWTGGVILDAEIVEHLCDLADPKGNNITVTLECCHSGSGTRPAELIIFSLPADAIARSVESRGDLGVLYTICEDFYSKIQKSLVSASAGGSSDTHGAYTNGGILYHNLWSHTVLAACASTENWQSVGEDRWIFHRSPPSFEPETRPPQSSPVNFQLCLPYYPYLGTYSEPRVTALAYAGAQSSSIPHADASVPAAQRSDLFKRQVSPVPFNFGGGGGLPLMLKLYPGQTSDAGFLRVFIPTNYADLLNIAQTSPMLVANHEEQAKKENETRKGRRRGVDWMPKDQTEAKALIGNDFWGVFTLPFIQHADS